jgi:hypothetical protein
MLELSMGFELVSADSGKKMLYTTAYTLPVSLSIAQPTAAHNLCGLESLQALVEQGLLDAPPPYVY